MRIALLLFVVFMGGCHQTYPLVADAKPIHPDTIKFIEALHFVETSCRVGAVIGDNGKSRGPLQIGRPYYADAVEYSGGRLNRPYAAVDDLTYAREVFLWYCYRYEPKALESGDFEVLARLHNGGPNWRYKKEKTNKYWNKVKKIL